MHDDPSILRNGQVFKDFDIFIDSGQWHAIKLKTMSAPGEKYEYRQIETADIPDLFEVRTATDENNLSLEQLGRLGITPETVAQKLASTYQGWLCRAEGRTVGFAMGDRATGELWVIAVLPEFVKKGIGGCLLELVEDWLKECGCRKLWLTTDVDTSLRAYSFYLKHGWWDDRIENGMRYMVKDLL
jgi:GNAT superfamily N-acetyltransferase